MEPITLMETMFFFFFCYHTLIIFSRLNFKHIVFSFLDKLVGLPYIVRKIQMSSFQPNWNRIQTSLVTPYMTLKVNKDPY